MVGRDLTDHLVPAPLPWTGTPSTRVLRAPSNLALNTAREGAATASLGNLFQGLTTLMVKNLFLISNLNLPSFSSEPFPLVLSPHTLVKSPSPSWKPCFKKSLQTSSRVMQNYFLRVFYLCSTLQYLFFLMLSRRYSYSITLIISIRFSHITWFTFVRSLCRKY